MEKEFDPAHDENLDVDEEEKPETSEMDEDSSEGSRRGRPPKPKPDFDPADLFKRPRGRPKKNPILSALSQTPRKRGRPAKDEEDQTGLPLHPPAPQETFEEKKPVSEEELQKIKMKELRLGLESELNAFHHQYTKLVADLQKEFERKASKLLTQLDVQISKIDDYDHPDALAIASDAKKLSRKFAKFRARADRDLEQTLKLMDQLDKSSRKIRKRKFKK